MALKQRTRLIESLFVTGALIHLAPPRQFAPSGRRIRGSVVGGEPLEPPLLQVDQQQRYCSRRDTRDSRRLPQGLRSVFAEFLTNFEAECSNLCIVQIFWQAQVLKVGGASDFIVLLVDIPRVLDADFNLLDHRIIQRLPELGAQCFT